jgi:hypothetical protein
MKTTAAYSAAASGGVAGAAVVLVTWALSLAHIEVPGEVAAAMMVLIAPMLHIVALRLGVERPAPDDTAAKPVAATPA